MTIFNGTKSQSSRLHYFLLLAFVPGVLLAACGDNPTTPATPQAGAAAQPTAQPPTARPTTAQPAPTQGTTLAGDRTGSGTPAAGATPAAATGRASGNIPDEIKPIYQAILADLGRRNVSTASGVQLLTFTDQEFRDSSLGCPDKSAMYTQVITPGYQLVVEANGQRYDYRSDQAGRRLVLCGPNGQPVPRLP